MAGLLPIGVLLALSAAAGGSTLSGALAWDGVVADEGTLSAAVLRSEGGGERLRLTTEGAGLSIDAALQPSTGEESTAWLPVPALDGAEVRVTGAAGRRLDIGTIRRMDAPVVVAGQTAASALGQRTDTIATNAAGLPGLVQAYAQVRALIMDGDTMGRLSEAQLRALASHLGRCGRVLLVDATPAVVDLMRRHAGCGGRLLMVAEASATAATLDHLLDTTAAALPDGERLQRLLAEPAGELRLIGRFLLGFLVMFLLLMAFPRTRATGLGLCVAAAVAAGLVWNGGAEQRFVAWAEVADGDGVARYASLGVASARGRGLQRLALEDLGREPQRIDGGPATLTWSADPDERVLDWTASLLQRLRVYSEGSFPVEPNLRAGVLGETAVACNQGAGRTPPATLYWQGRAYAVPALEPGEVWRAGDALPLPSPGPESRLLSRRAGALAILQPLVVPGNGGERRAWLMRTESTTMESTCHG